MNSKTIACDLDGVIHKYSRGWLDGSIYDKPVEGAREKLQLLVSSGFTVIVHTTREDTEAVKKWLKKNGFPELEVTNKKPIAMAYIDDRAIRFTNWDDVVRYFI